MIAVAALFVDARGIYSTLPGVDLWDIARDARSYAGPHPVVAHPPCERWGNYSEDAIGAKRWDRPRKITGDDGGCFESALASVRAYGGVLEHPRGSKAWRVYGLNTPPSGAGWIRADWHGGWTCCVEQGHYGHRARKPTWLYACRVSLIDLEWGVSSASIHTSPAPKQQGRREYMHRLERRSTPRPFAELLVRMAQSVEAKS